MTAGRSRSTRLQLLGQCAFSCRSRQGRERARGERGSRWSRRIPSSSSAPRAAQRSRARRRIARPPRGARRRRSWCSSATACSSASARRLRRRLARPRRAAAPRGGRQARLARPGRATASAPAARRSPPRAWRTRRSSRCTRRARVDDAFYLISELVDGDTLAQLIAEDALEDEEILEIGVALAERARPRPRARRDPPRHQAAERARARTLPQDGRTRRRRCSPPPSSPTSAARASSARTRSRAPATCSARSRTWRPSRARGARWATQADLYSLALVLYEALCGVNPVRGATPAATVRRIGRPLPPLERARRDLPRELTRRARPRARARARRARHARGSAPGARAGARARTHALSLAPARARPVAPAPRRSDRRPLASRRADRPASPAHAPAAALPRAPEPSTAGAGSEAAEHDDSGRSERPAAWRAAAARRVAGMRRLSLIVLAGCSRGAPASRCWRSRRLLAARGAARRASQLRAWGRAGSRARWRRCSASSASPVPSPRSPGRRRAGASAPRWARSDTGGWCSPGRCSAATCGSPRRPERPLAPRGRAR